MGAVYRARDTKLDRDVAIKVLLPAVANDPERLARFQREAKILAALNHPNIAHIHGIEEGLAGQDSQVGPFLVLELVEGPTLADIIAGSGLSALSPGRAQSLEPKVQSPKTHTGGLLMEEGVNRRAATLKIRFSAIFKNFADISTYAFVFCLFLAEYF